MSEQAPQVEHLETVQSRPFWRRPVVLGAAAAALAGVVLGAAGRSVYDRFEEQARQIESLSEAVSQQKGLTEEQERRLAYSEDLIAGLAGTTRSSGSVGELLQPETLAGYGDNVSDADRDLVRAATVKIVRRSKDTMIAWNDGCTGLKVDVFGESYIATASHCIDLGGMGGKGGLPGPAAEVSGASTTEYGVRNPKNENQQAVLGEVREISYAFDNDWALLRLDPATVQPELAVQPEVPYFERTISRMPLPGESAVIYSLPASAHGRMIEGEGVYLGSTEHPYYQGRRVDVVGLKDAGAAAEDACNYGASGSAAMLAGGRLTGPLAARNLVGGYETGQPVQQDLDNASTSARYRIITEDRLGVDTSRFNVLCFFSSADSGVLPKLVEGFDNILRPKSTQWQQHQSMK